jgi:hypothetical protein
MPLLGNWPHDYYSTSICSNNISATLPSKTSSFASDEQSKSCVFTIKQYVEEEEINHKQSARWHHLSWLKASAVLFEIFC